MKQKILTYFHPISDEESVFSMEGNTSELLEMGWHIKSVNPNVCSIRKPNSKGDMQEYDVLAITVLYEME